MSNIKLDSSHKPILAGLSSADSETPIEPWVNPTYRFMHVGIFDSSGNQIDTFDQSTPTSVEGAKVSVGTTAVEMTFSAATKSLSIQSDHDNTGAIWVGGSNITSAGANAFARLSAGQAVTFDLNDTSDAIYAISDTASQNVYKAALT